MILQKTSLIVLAAILTGCSTIGIQTSATDQAASDVRAEVRRLACDGFSVITYSRLDTRETKAQVQGHNARLACLCAADCPEKARLRLEPVKDR
jgi:hypothetical protein